MSGPAADQAPRIGGHEVRALLGTVADNAGILRAKLIPASKIDSACRTGVGLSLLVNAMGFDDHNNASTAVPGPSGDIRLIPDLARAVMIDCDRGLAWAPFDQFDQELNPLPLCQRATLKRVAADAQAAGSEYRLSFEIEFALYQEGKPSHEAPWHSARALLLLEPYVWDLLDTLEAAGVPVEQIHGESEPGMLEVAVAAADPLVAADRAVLVRLLINRVAARHGHQATFAPITGFGQLGSGCHAHLSVYSDGTNLLTAGDREYGITSKGDSAFAGVLHHLPGMIAVLAASPLSYQRLAPGNWSGAHVCWGRENRQAALRFVPGTIGIRQDAANFEVKSGDNTANPYLAAAALIAACQDGLGRGLKLPPPTEDDPATLSDAERRRCGITRLPESLDEAIRVLERNDVLRKAFGDALMGCYLAVRRGEAHLAAAMTPEQLVLRLRDRYC